jgi:hypothetical protein
MSILNIENSFSSVDSDETKLDIITEEEVANLSDEDLEKIQALLNPYLDEVKGNLNQFDLTIQEITKEGDSELSLIEGELDKNSKNFLEEGEEVGLDTVRAQIEAQKGEN